MTFYLYFLSRSLVAVAIDCGSSLWMVSSPRLIIVLCGYLYPFVQKCSHMQHFMQMAGNCSQDSLSTFNCSFMEPLSDLPLTYHFANGTVDFVQADYVRREKVQEKFNVFLTYLSVG